MNTQDQGDTEFCLCAYVYVCVRFFGHGRVFVVGPAEAWGSSKSHPNPHWTQLDSGFPFLKDDFFLCVCVWVQNNTKKTRRKIKWVLVVHCITAPEEGKVVVINRHSDLDSHRSSLVVVCMCLSVFFSLCLALSTGCNATAVFVYACKLKVNSTVLYNSSRVTNVNKFVCFISLFSPRHCLYILYRWNWHWSAYSIFYTMKVFLGLLNLIPFHFKLLNKQQFAKFACSVTYETSAAAICKEGIWILFLFFFIHLFYLLFKYSLRKLKNKQFSYVHYKGTNFFTLKKISNRDNFTSIDSQNRKRESSHYP